MKKFLFAAAAVLSISVSAYLYTQKDSLHALNDLAMANVEALANEEGGPNGYKYVDSGSEGSGVACVCWKPGNSLCCY